MIFFHDKNGTILASVEASSEIEKGFTMPNATPVVVPEEIAKLVRASKDPRIINSYQVVKNQVVLKPIALLERPHPLTSQ
jgi:hypothetical protein